MDAVDVETSMEEGEQTLQALLQFARGQAATLEAHEAQQRIFLTFPLCSSCYHSCGL